MAEPVDPPADPLRSLGNASGAWVWDFPNDRLYADARFALLCGLDPDQARTGLPTSAFVAGVAPEDRLRIKIALAGVRHGSELFSKEYRVHGSDEVVRWVSARGRVTQSDQGTPLRFEGMLVDITDQKRVEDQLLVAQTAGGVGTFEHTAGFGTADVSEQFCRLLGLQPTDALPVRTINAVVVEGDAPIIGGPDGRDDATYAEIQVRRADTGEVRWIARRGEYRNDGIGGGLRFLGVIYDISPAKAAESELRVLARTLEERVAERTKERDRVWNRARDLFVVMSRQQQYLATNPAWKTVLGYEAEDLLGREHGSLAHPDDLSTRQDLLRRVNAGERVDDVDVRIRAKDGNFRWINWTVIPDDDAIYAMGRDVTDRKGLEEQLRQSQKMEAVGQLTGGLAHDFNNMLTGITGGLDIARRRIERRRPEEAGAFIDMAMAAAERAAALTHRLLAFSRRQSLDPHVLDVPDLLNSMEVLLRRTLGEQIDLKIASDPQPLMARADANQLESAVLNLAINARDAMPNGGRLAVEARSVSLSEPLVTPAETVPPGDYVEVSVADTGEGMPADVLAKVFEPFFTTKPIGQGTGLGLSMVYGFVRQSGGHVTVESEEGAGARVALYLPRVEAAGSDRAVQAPRAADALRGHGERVLIVEDDLQVRQLVHAVLSELGYATEVATDGDAALALLDSGLRVNLLVTDVGLPGINGRQLADLARVRIPDLPVVFMTGYAPDAAERSAFLAPGMRMITKPFNIDALAAELRSILESVETR